MRAEEIRLAHVRVVLAPARILTAGRVEEDHVWVGAVFEVEFGRHGLQDVGAKPSKG